MNYKHKDIEGSRREFTIDIPHKEVQQRFSSVLDQIGKTAKIPGFREGKVPRELLERHYGATARERVLSDLVSDSYREAIKESNTVPVGLPLISDAELKDGKDFSYKATIDIRPKISIKAYKNIKIKKKAVDVKGEDVEKYILVVKESYAQFKSVENRTAKLNDYIVCDIVCEVDGKPLYDQQKDVLFSLDRDHSLPELVDGLMGVSNGDKREIEATLPENKEQPEYSKKRALFKVDTKTIKEKEPPEINDEFVKSLGAYKDVGEFKEAVKKDLIRKQENNVKTDMINQVLEWLLKNALFSPPQGLVDQEAERLIQEAKDNLRKRNVPNDQIEKRDAELRANLKNEAARRVRLFFLLDEIAKIEKIEVSDEEIDQALEVLARQSRTSKEELKKHYIENNLMTSLKGQLRENKVIDFLIDNANIKEGR